VRGLTVLLNNNNINIHYYSLKIQKLNAMVIQAIIAFHCQYSKLFPFCCHCFILPIYLTSIQDHVITLCIIIAVIMCRFAR
jgi:hypothetical protein